MRSALLLKLGGASTFTTLQGTGKNDWKSSISHPAHSDFEICLKEKRRGIMKRDGKAFRDLMVSVKELGSQGRGQGSVTVWVKFGGKLVARGIVSLLLKLGNLHTVLTHFVSGRSPFCLFFNKNET